MPTGRSRAESTASAAGHSTLLRHSTQRLPWQVGILFINIADCKCFANRQEQSRKYHRRCRTFNTAQALNTAATLAGWYSLYYHSRLQVPCQPAGGRAESTAGAADHSALLRHLTQQLPCMVGILFINIADCKCLVIGQGAEQKVPLALLAIQHCSGTQHSGYPARLVFSSLT